MGSLLTKDSNKPQESTLSESTPTKPILTPNSRILEIDPRSPSAHICRTPIVISGAPLKDEFDAHDTFNLVSPGVINKILLDPRSPAVEFIRTPIVAQDKPKVLRNKNFDNVLNYTPKQRKPKLLDSTPITPALKSLSKRKSFAGYLETNLDFVETNLDEVILRKSLSNLCTKSDYTPIKSMVNCIENENLNITNSCESAIENHDKKSSFISNIYTSSGNNSKMQDILDDIIDDVFKIEDIKTDIIPRIVAISPKPRKIIKSFDKKIKDLIYEESQLEKINDENFVEAETIFDVKENKIEKKTSDVAIQKLDNIDFCNTKDELDNEKHVFQEVGVGKTLINNMNLEDTNVKTAEKHKDCLKESGIRPRKTNITRGIKNTSTQEKTVVKDTKRIDNVIKRVALTDRNGSNKIHTIPKLRVHDKPRKSQYSVSKIPQFKGKHPARVSSVQCENTPPAKNASVWDNEETLVI